MSSVGGLNESDLSLILRYSLESDEDMVEAVVNAFLAADVEIYDRPTRLVDWVNADIFEQIQWASGRPFYLATRIWDHGVVLTPEEVRIYRGSDLT